MLTLKEINDFMDNIVDWSLDNDSIVKEFSFKNFNSAIKFIENIVPIIEKHDHNPDIIISRNRVRIILITDSEKGLTKKDFEVAGEIDKIPLI
jgi:4a-hydroxytetrahydrobiopterin dehydratase